MWDELQRKSLARVVCYDNHVVSVADISLGQRDLILALPEGHFHDLKSKDIAPGKLTKTISAFVNAAGGELYIGVDERSGPGGAKIRSWRGFVDPEEANGHLQAFEQISPLGTYVRPTFLRSPADSGLVLQLEILKTRRPHFTRIARIFTRAVRFLPFSFS